MAYYQNQFYNVENIFVLSTNLIHVSNFMDFFLYINENNCTDIWPSRKLPFKCQKMPINLTFKKKNLPKFSFFSKKLPMAIFLKKMEIFGKFFEKCQVFVNFLTFKWQFSGGSDWYHNNIKHWYSGERHFFG